MSARRRGRRQRIDSTGINGVKIGAPPLIGDLYYATMEMSWPVFVALVSIAYLLVNLGFGLVYAALPGAIGNAAPGSIADGFFFSVETLGTVGYGNMAPVTHLGHTIAACEILIGLFFSATMTGLIFARFSRPRAMLVCSRVAIVAQRADGRALMIRIASLRSHPVTDISAQLFWMQRDLQPDGGFTARFVELPLAEHHMPVLPLTWTLRHAIDPASPFAQALADGAALRLLVSVSGTYSLLGSQTIAERVYGRSDIREDMEFVEIVSEKGDAFVLNLRHIHDTRPRPAEPAAPRRQ